MKRASAISLLVTLAAFMLLVSSCDRSRDRDNTVSFNDRWLFIRQDSANADKILPGIIPNHKWEEVSLPHTAFIEPLVISGRQWTGICWYKKIYRPEKRQRHRHTGLLFDGAMNDAIVYLNGVEVARHTGGYLPFYVNLSDDLEYGKENEIMVRLDNRQGTDNTCAGQSGDPDFLWYSGLYRNVSLTVTDRLHITSPAEYNVPLGGGIITGIRDVGKESATLTLSVHIANDDRTPRSFRMKNTLLDAAGIEVASSLSELTELEPGYSDRLMTRMIVMQPSLWTPATPFLYTIRTELLTDNGIVIDSRETRTGIRSVRVSPDKGLMINGEPVRFTGTNRRQEYPYIGYALSDEASYRDAFKIREAGFNLVRCSNYPPSPAFLSACDEIGLMVIDAIPGWRYMSDSLFTEAAISETRMMCRRDRNHPSVVMWEASVNGRPLPYSLAEMLHQAVKEELPLGNNITCSSTETIFDVFMAVRDNAEISGSRIDYRGLKPLFMAEYGIRENQATCEGPGNSGTTEDEPGERIPGYTPGDGESQMLQQALIFQKAHNENLIGPGFGDACWLMFDFNRRNSPVIEASGVMDIFRLPRFSYWFYRSQGDEGPFCRIAHHNLPSSGNTVMVYSNADTIILFRNDTLVAAQGPDTDSSAVNLRHPPFTFTLSDYEPGTLRASAIRKGAEVATHSVTTPGRPVTLRLAADFSNKPLQGNGADVVFVYATLIDSAGNTVPLADSLVTFTVRGNAGLIGNNPARARGGIATILLRSDDPGKIMIKASSTGMSEAELMTESR